MDKRRDLILRVADIIDATTVDGPGFRTSIYFSGCAHHCPGCQNPSTWDPMSGKEMSIGQIVDRILENDYDVTFSGGDPLYQAENLMHLSKIITDLGRRIWCYTGFRFEQIMNDDRYSPLLEYFDVIVDGRFEIDKRNIDLLFRGSENQRLIDLVNWRATGEIREWESDF